LPGQNVEWGRRDEKGRRGGADDTYAKALFKNENGTPGAVTEGEDKRKRSQPTRRTRDDDVLPHSTRRCVNESMSAKTMRGNLVGDIRKDNHPVNGRGREEKVNQKRNWQRKCQI